MKKETFINTIKSHRQSFHPVVTFDPLEERIISLDFTDSNQELTADIIENTEKFSEYINNKLQTTHSKFGIGGYAEHRTVYSRSPLFGETSKAFSRGEAFVNLSTETAEPRRLHLGIDIWGQADTKVFAPLGGMVHSFAFNNHFGDYGVTIILLHQLDEIPFYTLYGHLSLKDIQNLKEGTFIDRGNLLAHFGEPHENGHWPPHLHFQIIFDLELNKGDYPGVCKFSEREKYLSNCPDPDLILQMNKYMR